MNTVLEHIYDYENYRNFLTDYFAEMKRMKKFFSHRYFAQKAGFASPSYFSYVIQGKRNLTLESTKKMISGIGLTGKAAEYFENLVNYNQSDSAQEKSYHYEKLKQIKKSREFYRVNKSQAAFYHDWYIPVIRELVVYADWNGDYEKLASLLVPEISAQQAKEAVEILLGIGLIKKDKNGKYYEESEALTAFDVPVDIIKRQRKKYLLRGMEAADKLPPDIRHISYVSVALSEESYKDICGMIDDLRRKILSVSTTEKSIDRVYHVNFQVFPLSENIKKLD